MISIIGVRGGSCQPRKTGGFEGGRGVEASVKRLVGVWVGVSYSAEPFACLPTLDELGVFSF